MRGVEWAGLGRGGKADREYGDLWKLTGKPQPLEITFNKSDAACRLCCVHVQRADVPLAGTGKLQNDARSFLIGQPGVGKSEKLSKNLYHIILISACQDTPSLLCVPVVFFEVVLSFKEADMFYNPHS